MSVLLGLWRMTTHAEEAARQAEGFWPGWGWLACLGLVGLIWMGFGKPPRC